MKKVTDLTNAQVMSYLTLGGKVVQYQYCISFVLVTLTRQSPLFMKMPKERGVWLGIKYAIFSLLLGPWCFPWGPLRTLQSLFINLRGGRDMTSSVVAFLKLQGKKTVKEGGETQID